MTIKRTSVKYEEYMFPCFQALYEIRVGSRPAIGGKCRNVFGSADISPKIVGPEGKLLNKNKAQVQSLSHIYREVWKLKSLVSFNAKKLQSAESIFKLSIDLKILSAMPPKSRFLFPTLHEIILN